MPIFRRDPDAPAGAAPAEPRSGAVRPVESRSSEPGPAMTHVVTGSRVVGEITGGAGVQIDGELEGRITVDHTVVVGPQGKVRGSLEARTVRVAGRVEGNVRGRERVEITPSGSLEGDISAPRVTIAEGAFFKGQVEMTGETRRSQGRSGPAPPGSPERGRE